jgi:hypothetical protein
MDNVLFGIVSLLYFWFVVEAKDGDYILFNHTISSYCFFLNSVCVLFNLKRVIHVYIRQVKVSILATNRLAKDVCLCKEMIL